MTLGHLIYLKKKKKLKADFTHPENEERLKLTG